MSLGGRCSDFYLRILRNLTTRVSIHQPNFLPWIGYFQKILTSDVHIILDDVHIPKTGSSWSNRVQICNGGKPQWLTVALRKEHGKQYTVQQMEAVDEWQSRIKNVLFSAYRKSVNFDFVYSFVEDLLNRHGDSLFEFNLHFTREVMKQLMVTPPVMKMASDIRVTTTGTDRLRDLIESVRGTRYLCGHGSTGYLDPAVLRASRIEIDYVEPVLHPYPQVGAQQFIEGLSIIDALFNCPIDEVRKILLARKS
jgi:hypothetical protein